MYNTDVLCLIISDWEDEPNPKKPKISKSKTTPASKKGMTVVLKWVMVMMKSLLYKTLFLYKLPWCSGKCILL